jgi:hypothetical protein
MDFDRGIQSLDLPVSGTASNLWTSDGDLDLGNNWVGQQASEMLAWTGPNPVGWGTLVSFSLESPHPPASLSARMAVANAAVPGQTIEIPTLAPAPLRLVDFSRTGQQLTWPAIPGARYRVEVSVSLNPLQWSEVFGVLTLSNSTAMFDPPPASDPLRIYRVVQVSP